MSSVAQRTVLHPAYPAVRFRIFLDKYFYFIMSLVMVAVVVGGFGRTVDPVMFHPVVPPPAILWVHAAIFFCWMLFFIFQSALVRTRNVKWHRFFGWFGVGLGACMIPVGLATALEMSRFEIYRMHRLGTYAFFITPLADITSFTALLALAIAWRKRPDLHRRLIFIATCVLLSAAFGRFPFLSQHKLPYATEDMVIFLGVLRDLVVDRRVHRAYLIALPALAVCQIFVMHTVSSGAPWWLRIAHGIIG